MSNVTATATPTPGSNTTGFYVKSGREAVPPVEIAVTIAVVVLGAYVAYQAYRGYRRNDSRPMLYFGVGVFAIATVRPLLFLLSAFLIQLQAPLFLFVEFFLVSAVALVSILYAFLMR
jgi:hypothetical protein